MKIKRTYETEVFVNQPGYLTIKQLDEGRGDDQIIMLSPEQAQIVIEEMQRLLAQAGDWWTVEAEEEEEAA